MRTERVMGGSKKVIEKVCGVSFYFSLFSRVSSKFYTYILLLFLLLLIYIIFFSPNNETVRFILPPLRKFVLEFFYFLFLATNLDFRISMDTLHALLLRVPKWFLHRTDLSKEPSLKQYLLSVNVSLPCLQ